MMTTPIIACVLYAACFGASLQSQPPSISPNLVSRDIVVHARLLETSGMPSTQPCMLSVEAEPAIGREFRRLHVVPDAQGNVVAQWRMNGAVSGLGLVVRAHRELQSGVQAGDAGRLYLAASDAVSGMSITTCSGSAVPTTPLVARAGTIVLAPLVPHSSVFIQDPTATSVSIHLAHGSLPSLPADFVGLQSLIVASNRVVVLYACPGAVRWVAAGVTNSGRRVPNFTLMRGARMVLTAVATGSIDVGPSPSANTVDYVCLIPASGYQPYVASGHRVGILRRIMAHPWVRREPGSSPAMRVDTGAYVAELWRKPANGGFSLVSSAPLAVTENATTQVAF